MNMKIIKGKIIEDFDRDLYWTRVVFLSKDESKKTQVLACASLEYLEDLYRIGNGTKLTESHLAGWLDNVIKKWSSLNLEFFNQDIHYDVYANTQEGEANGLDFLIVKSQSR